MQFDEVLRLAAVAIDGLAEMLGAAFERGADVAEIEPARGRFAMDGDAPLLGPALGAGAPPRLLGRTAAPPP